MKFYAKIKIVLISIIILIGLFAFITWQNNSISITNIEYKNIKIPEEFNGYKILHISDLHNKTFGTKQINIVSKIKKINPDVIVITGDLIDSNTINFKHTMDLIAGVIDIAPVYYVSGNHEARSGSYDDLKSELENAGATVLDNQKTELLKDGRSIDIVGLADVSFIKTVGLEYEEVNRDDNGNSEAHYIEAQLSNLVQTNSTFKILLSHRPDLFEVYSNSDVDLVFSGHAHGGQFRLPFLGGLIAPNQGFFPKLTEGIHTLNGTSIVISRGLGNSIIPIRLFNRPELIVVTISR